MKNVYIIGAGGLGREIETWIEQDSSFNQNYEIKGYIDDNCNALESFPSKYKVLGNLSYPFKRDEYVILAIANAEGKKNIVDDLKERVQFLSYISDKSLVSQDAVLGLGVVVCPHVIISTNTVINDFSLINIGSQVGHDAEIGPYSSLMAGVDIGGGAKVGEGCFMGTHSCLIPRKKIGDNITVGIGAVVIRNLKKVGTYFGNPAMLIS
ncbi:MAG: NeuD/PglB/VioB family sugar acetyltransferase [Vallitalea sp.]|nr:NeuD/PglB/VioB family sugar acetyltransferase [Vallitalea sp.]